MSIINQYWPLVLETLRNKTSESNYKAWFARVEFVSLEEQGRKIIISVPSAFAKNYIESKFKKTLQESINKYYPQVIHVEYRIDENKAKIQEVSQEVLNLEEKESSNPLTKNKPAKEENKSSYLPSRSINALNPKYTFDNFVVTKNNEMAANVAGAITQELGKLYNPLFIYSKVGLGKTHLLQAIGNKVLEDKPNLNIKYLPAETFINQFILSLQKRESAQFRAYYKAVDVILIDDIQFLAGKESTQEQFFHIFNELQQANKQIVLTSDKSPQEIIGIEDRLISRFSMGMVVDVSQMDLEDKLAIIEDKVKRMKLPLTQEQIIEIANANTANVRDIEGILNKIQARISFLPNRAFTNGDLDMTLHGMFVKSTNNISDLTMAAAPTSTTDKILSTVAKLFALDREEIIGPSRKKDVSLARQIVFWLYKNELDLSYPIIGSLFGGRNHSTVMHGYNKINSLIKVNIKIKQKVDLIRSQLSQEK